MYHSMKESPYLFKKIKNKKGFTLIELLAVIVVLAVILIIAVPAIGKVIENARNSAYLDNEKMMESATRTYAIKNSNILPREIGEKETIDLTTLINNNYISEIKDPKDSSSTCNGYVEIEKKSKKKYTYDAYLQCGDNYTTQGMTVSEKVIDTNPGILSGTGIEEDPFLIESIEDLVAFGQAVDGGNDYEGQYVRLNTNLDIDNNSYYVNPTTTSFGDINGNGTEEGLRTELTTGMGFDPIGDGENYFSGHFNGNSKVITNLYINRTAQMVGLFSAVLFGEVTDLGLVDVDISVNATYVGGVAGAIGVATISNSYVTGELINTIESFGPIGGLVGMVTEGGTVSNSYTSVSIEANSFAGGFVGDILEGTVSNSYATGIVSATGLSGGFVGVIEDAVIRNCYSMATVEGQIIIGGFIGNMTGESTIENSYAAGNINGFYENGDIGGFIGDDSSITFTNSYRYNNLVCTGCTNTNGLPVTAANLGSSDWHRNTLGWNSQWSLTNGKYPLLYKKDTTTLLERQKLINTP